MRQSRLMSLVEAAGNVAVGLLVKIGTLYSSDEPRRCSISQRLSVVPWLASCSRDGALKDRQTGANVRSFPPCSTACLDCRKSSAPHSAGAATPQ